MDVSQTIEFETSSSKQAWLVVCAFLVAAMGLGYVWPAISESRSDRAIGAIDWVVACLLWAAALRGFWLIAGPKPLALQISPHGFHHSWVSTRTIPWTQVQGVRPYRNGFNSLLIVKVGDASWRSGGVSRLMRLLRVPNSMLGADGLWLPMLFASTTDEIAEYFEAYARAHGGRLD